MGLHFYCGLLKIMSSAFQVQFDFRTRRVKNLGAASNSPSVLPAFILAYTTFGLEDGLQVCHREIFRGDFRMRTWHQKE